MKKKYFILIIFPVLLIAGISYESIYYAEWYVPLSTIDQDVIFFSDTHIGLIKEYSSTTLTSIEYLSFNSIKATFNQNDFFIGNYSIPDEFEFIKTIYVGDKFIEFCHPDGIGVNHISIMHLVNVNTTHVIFDHYSGILPNGMECKYPEIIEHSFDIEWNEFQKTNSTEF